MKSSQLVAPAIMNSEGEPRPGGEPQPRTMSAGETGEARVWRGARRCSRREQT